MILINHGSIRSVGSSKVYEKLPWCLQLPNFILHSHHLEFIGSRNIVVNSVVDAVAYTDTDRESDDELTLSDIEDDELCNQKEEKIGDISFRC